MIPPFEFSVTEYTTFADLKFKLDNHLHHKMTIQEWLRSIISPQGFLSGK